MLSLLQLKEEARKLKYELLDHGFKPIQFEMNNSGVRILNKIDSLITKAYEEGKKDKDSEPVEEIPQMKGTLEALDKLTPSNH